MFSLWSCATNGDDEAIVAVIGLSTVRPAAREATRDK
jgi:hypothetical protein